MKRAILVLLLTTVGLVGLPRPAAAGIWAWLEEFSGPGPFKGVYGFVNSACFPARMTTDPRGNSLEKRGPELSPLLRDRDRSQNVPCIYFDRSKLTVGADPVQGWPKIDALLWDTGGAVRVNNWVDLGMGVGQIGFKVGNETHRKLILTPARVVIRPLLLFKTSDRGRPWAAILNVYLKETFVFGPMDGATFGAPAVQFKSDGELKTSFGIMLDLTAPLNSLFNR